MRPNPIDFWPKNWCHELDAWIDPLNGGDGTVREVVWPRRRPTPIAVRERRAGPYMSRIVELARNRPSRALLRVEIVALKKHLNFLLSPKSFARFDSRFRRPWGLWLEDTKEMRQQRRREYALGVMDCLLTIFRPRQECSREMLRSLLVAFNSGSPAEQEAFLGRLFDDGVRLDRVLRPERKRKPLVVSREDAALLVEMKRLRLRGRAKPEFLTRWACNWWKPLTPLEKWDKSPEDARAVSAAIHNRWVIASRRGLL